MTSSTKHRALITGASSGIGKATALAFASAGIDVALVSRSERKLETVVQQAVELGVEAKAYPFDLAKIEGVKAGIDAIAADFGTIDILVNNAGMGYTGELLETSLSDWQQVMDLNLTSVFQCIQAILPGMRDRAQGTIINIASLAAQTPFPGWGAYSVSKAGLVALSKVLAAEEKANGIRVVALSPGAVNTPIWDTDTVQADLNRSAMLTPEIVAQSILHVALLPEQAAIEELTLTPSAGAL
ncbi:SDR family oxidoreductase [Lusitaniella coriacea LEGE 07157]|uniref:SDR family oxidoreductase n=1 Tax=Lusitaniella coriacea LEGE 07157 TaxID=945747 RepID=A0A8J7J588_9CYAN|nr:SDR family oxidoreductase [Lusitaniella coriacea]MBE9117874.1 SDR family oxidoreductase [Lusitaniella coriacea LEGE 07157]